MVSSRKLPCGESANSGKKYAPWDCSAFVCKRFRKFTLQLLQTQVKILKNSMHIITKTRHKLPGGGGSCVFRHSIFGWILCYRGVWRRYTKCLQGFKTKQDASIAESTIKQKDIIPALSAIAAERHCENHTGKATLKYTFFFLIHFTRELLAAADNGLLVQYCIPTGRYKDTESQNNSLEDILRAHLVQSPQSRVTYENMTWWITFLSCRKILLQRRNWRGMGNDWTLGSSPY